MDIKRIIIFLLSALALICTIQIIYNYMKKKSSLEKADEWIASKKLEKSKVLSFFNGNFGYNIYFDDVHKIAVFLNVMRGIHLYVKTSDILGVDVIQDGANLIFSDNTEPTKKIKSLIVNVHTEGGGDNDIMMIFCNEKTSTGSKDYLEKIDFIKKMKSEIEKRM